MPTRFLKSSSGRRKQKNNTNIKKVSNLQSKSDTKNEVSDSKAFIKTITKKSIQPRPRKLNPGKTKSTNLSENDHSVSTSEQPNLSSTSTTPESDFSFTKSRSISADNRKPEIFFDNRIQNGQPGAILNDISKEKIVKEVQLPDGNADQLFMTSSLGNISSQTNSIPISENITPQINNIPNLGNELQVIYGELLSKYEALVLLRETRAESLFREYKLAAEQRFKASESLIEKLQNEMQNHICCPSEKLNEVSLHEIKEIIPQSIANEAILDLYGRMLGISVDPVSGSGITWKLSIRIPSKGGGVFECLLRESRPDTENETKQRMIEYVPMTLAQNNEYREQCLRELPKDPPSYLLETIAFKSPSLSTFIFNLVKWIRSPANSVHGSKAKE